MLTIHKGIAANIEVGSVEAITATDIVVALYNPATGYYTAFFCEQGSATSLTCSITSANTILMPVGNYNLEVYTSDKTDMLYFEENFARVLPSSAEEVNFIKTSYIVVNNLKYERYEAADYSQAIMTEFAFNGQYAWRYNGEETVSPIEAITLRTAQEEPSAGMLTYYTVDGADTQSGDPEEHEYDRLTEYDKANI